MKLERVRTAVQKLEASGFEKPVLQVLKGFLEPNVEQRMTTQQALGVLKTPQFH